VLVVVVAGMGVMVKVVVPVGGAALFTLLVPAIMLHVRVVAVPPVLVLAINRHIRAAVAVVPVLVPVPAMVPVMAVAAVPSMVASTIIAAAVVEVLASILVASLRVKIAVGYGVPGISAK
jgi:hypothetical protein